MNKRTLMYVAAGLVLLYLVTRKASPASSGGSGGANNSGVNADMGGVNFGAVDPTAAW